jgi:DNA polymerase-3 subunit delta
MNVAQLLSDLQKKIFQPFYWLEGEEEYAIDQVIDYAEHNILQEAEASFNLHVFYGRDTEWATILNSCMRYPMFSEKQVIILKEAQSMKDIEKLEPYLNKTLNSSLLFIAYKGKKVDKRTRFAKTLKDKGVMLTTRKLYENELPEWTNALVKLKGYNISNKALYLLIEHIGNDLNRISNEIDKVIINL